MFTRSIRPLALAALAALGLATAAAPALAQSQQGSAAAQRERERDDARNASRSGPGGGRPTTAAQRTRGMAEAPAVIQAAGVPCQLADAMWIGNSGTRKAYEVACTGSLGYILVTAEQAGGAPTVQDCVAIDTLARRELAANPAATPNRCTLPGNADPKAGLAPFVTQAGRTCTINNARAIGEGSGLMRYEIGCSEGSGFLLDRPTPGSTTPLRTVSCLEASAANIVCEYTPREAISASLQRAVASQTPPCPAIANYRWMGRSQDNQTEYVELACGSAGYVAQMNNAGAVQQWFTCDRAAAIGGGCTLTSAAVASTQENGLYTTAARGIGYNCDVQRYRRIGREANNGREVVELVCAGQPESSIAFLPVPNGTGQGEYIDCVVGAARQVPCQLNPISTTYPRVTREIAGKGQTCNVSELRGVGAAPDGSFYVEAACGGTPGYFLQYRGRTLASVITCREASGIGGGCTLPANRAAAPPARR